MRPSQNLAKIFTNTDSFAIIHQNNSRVTSAATGEMDIRPEIDALRAEHQSGKQSSLLEVRRPRCVAI